MSQTLDKLSTGKKDLDDDLRELFAICEDKKKLDAIKQAIANKDISSEEFTEIVPKVLMKLLFLLGGPQFPILSGRINKEAVNLVKEAKSLIEKHFGNLFENENAESLLRSEMMPKERDHIDSLADEVIGGIAHYLIWEDEPPELTPAVRMAFKKGRTKILLNTRLDWEDLSFFLNNLAEIFVELLEKGKTLAELGQIDLSVSKEVSKNIEETLGNLQKLKKIMPIYKAKTELDKNGESVKDSSS